MQGIIYFAANGGAGLLYKEDDPEAENRRGAKEEPNDRREGYEDS